MVPVARYRPIPASGAAITTAPTPQAITVARSRVLSSRAVDTAAVANTVYDHRLVVEDLCCLRGERIVLDGVGFCLEPGSAVQLEGPNGSGKTTLLRAICGLAPVASGRIYWDGFELDPGDEAFLAALTWIGDTPGVKRDLTPLENLAVQRALLAVPPRMTDAGALARVGLGEHAETPLRYLSAGQCRRAALARLAGAPSALWVLDEPLTALDAGGKALVEDLIGEHLARGGLCVISTHQRLELAPCSVRIRLGEAA